MKFEILVKPLTKRENEICDIICTGAGNIAIGKQLGITTGTVQSHMHSIIKKLNVDSRLQVAIMTTRRKCYGKIQIQ